MAEFSNIIAELRKEAGYTQKTLAEALHITDKAVSKWERGLSLPDTALLPKLSLLLGADMSLFLSSEHPMKQKWAGIINLAQSNAHFDQMIYDKPMVDYLLMHYLLLGIHEIYFYTDERNEAYLSNDRYNKFGFTFCFQADRLPAQNYMILDRPLFLFGSDLTRQFQGAMVTESAVKLAPTGQLSTFVFCPESYLPVYEHSPKFLLEIAAERNLGRGMINIELSDADRISDAANFVRLYQKNTGLRIGDLEEIADSRG